MWYIFVHSRLTKMEMESRRMLKFLCAATALTLLGTSAAHADLRVTQKTSIQNQQLTAMIQSMSPQQRAQMAQAGSLFSGKPLSLVISTHGKEARIDLGPQSTIFNAATHKVITLDRKSRTYSISTVNANSAPTVNATIHATNQSQIIQGHKARRYQVSLTSPQLEGGRLTGDIWVAPDLPSLPTSLLAGSPASALQSLFQGVKGLPLKINALITGTPEKPLSPALFQVPHGYKRVAASAAPQGLP
jgi:hypothetical protein